MVNFYKVKDPGFLHFFFPDYCVRDVLSYRDIENKILYCGKNVPNLRGYLQDRTRDFISTVGSFEVDLTQRVPLIQFVQSKHKHELSSNLQEKLEMLDDDQFVAACKHYWICGKWPTFITGQRDTTVFDLFKESSGSTPDLLRTYFSLMDSEESRIVESSYITFLSRVKSIDSQDVSPYYLKVLKSMSDQYRNAIDPALLTALTKTSVNSEHRLLDLILNIRGRK